VDRHASCGGEGVVGGAAKGSILVSGCVAAGSGCPGAGSAAFRRVRVPQAPVDKEYDADPDSGLGSAFGAEPVDAEPAALPPLDDDAADALLDRDLAGEADLATRWPESILEPTLDRIRGVVELLGDPQTATPVIHLAGTNGKTSTSRMIESLLRSFGLRTGLFTSPHLHSVRERIRLDGEPIDMERFVRIHTDIAPYLGLVDRRSVEAGGPRLSYFEVLTAMAYAAFADAPVDVAIVETGMGGAWDATNVADGHVAVVLPVDIDHAEYLGPDVATMAAAKAGLVTDGAPAVLAIVAHATAAA